MKKLDIKSGLSMNRKIFKTLMVSVVMLEYIRMWAHQTEQNPVTSPCSTVILMAI